MADKQKNLPPVPKYTGPNPPSTMPNLRDRERPPQAPQPGEGEASHSTQLTDEEATWMQQGRRSPADLMERRRQQANPDAQGMPTPVPSPVWQTDPERRMRFARGGSVNYGTDYRKRK